MAESYPRVLGIDQSLTSTGLAHVYGPDTVELSRVRPAPARGHQRIEAILRRVAFAARGADLAVAEGLSFAAKGNSLLDLAGLQHLIRHLLWTLGVPYAVVEPTVRAKYITGRGNATKDEVLAAAIKRFPEVDITSNDTADAMVLAHMGRHWMGHPLVAMPHAAAELLVATHTDKRRRGQPVIAWPELP